MVAQQKNNDSDDQPANSSPPANTTASVPSPDKPKDREDYGNLTTPPNTIVLQDPDKHMGGYGRNECLICHNTALNVHRRPGAIINVDELNRMVRDGLESKYCLTCHGMNGTSGN